ncbi:SET domain-containing protein [Obba rivulosa]|uniref:SET domain-containing protein n=1 Tax=Obba rivulosa TaxID=1052685 RepID=A0A8E2B2Y0_9APHY|nr:SET domain-containing protein [Obba rivulosa]
MWEASPPPEEDWGDDANRAWPVKRVVDEYVDAFGVKKYEIKWDDWSRPDGTNTTWEEALIGNEELIAEWEARQAGKRSTLAKKSLSLPVAPMPDQLWQEDRTVELSRAYEEKLREARRRNIRKTYENWDKVKRIGPAARDTSGDDGDDHDEDEDMDDAVSERSQRPRRSLTSEDMSRDGRIRPGAGPRPPQTGRPDRTPSPPHASESDVAEELSCNSVPLSRLIRGKRPVTPPATSRVASRSLAVIARPTKVLPKRAARHSSELSSPSRSRRDQRKALQEEWRQAVVRAGAASVRIVNEVNSDKTPPIPDGFRYIERQYARAPDVPQSAEALNCLVMCECDDICTDAGACQCQDPSDIINDFEEREFAYDHERHFRFNVPPGVDVIECNKTCTCPRLCPNRVAQLPRDVPLEIFRTADRGWGVRATITVHKGKVIGIYTGELIRRDEADLRVDHRSYIFDLDMHEGPESEIDESQRFSVDSYAVGNWSRFLNHSCEPNLQVYPVVWDTIPEANQPYLAFVATQTIHARTELTIDYDPNATLRRKKGKSRAAARIPPGATACKCGANVCRGWVRV